MIIKTTAAAVLSSKSANGQYNVTLIDPDIASIFEQLITITSKIESVKEIATANLEAAMSKTFPVTAPKSKPVTLAEITNAVHEAAEALLQKP